MAAEANEAGGQEVRVLRAEVQQVRAQITEATAAAEQNASRLREEIERLRAELEHERSRKFMHRVVDAAQGAKTLRAEIGQLRTQLTEANQAIEQERGAWKHRWENSGQNSSSSVREGSFANSSDYGRGRRRTLRTPERKCVGGWA